MAENQVNLGGRLPLLDPRELKGHYKELYNFLDTTFISWAGASGFLGKTDDDKLIGPFNPNLHSPGITPSWVQLVQAESKTTSLTTRQREVVILSVGAVWRAPYVLYAHSAVARKAGLPEPAIQALVAGESSDQLSMEEQVAHRFARQLAREFRIESDLYLEAESLFGRAGLVDMIYLIGIYLLTSAMLNAFEIPAPV